MERLKLYIMESYNELINKVTWPSRASLYSQTVIVIVSSIIISLIIFLMDVVSKGVLDQVYGLGG